MTGTVKAYAWGSTTVLPRFLGREPDGTPQAELWLGAHASAPSLVGEKSLGTLIAADPTGTVGAASVARFGPQLPYLLKVLAAAQPLSLQAHPSRAQAEQGFARETAAGLASGSAERVFADDWPKPEMMVALTPVDALCGFRDPAKTYGLFARFGVDDLLRLVEPLQTGAPESLREVLSRLLRLAEAGRPMVAQVVAAASEIDQTDPELADFARTAVGLNGSFPGDVGIVAALLLNRLRLEPGEALYLPAGNMHAYLGGAGIEIMANSDNTLRGGLTSKLVAVDALLEILDYTPGRPPLVVPVADEPGVWRYPTPAREFCLWRLEPAEAPLRVPAAAAGRIVLVADGTMTLSEGDVDTVLARGAAAFCFPDDVVTISGRGSAFVAGPGI